MDPKGEKAHVEPVDGDELLRRALKSFGFQDQRDHVDRHSFMLGWLEGYGARIEETR